MESKKSKIKSQKMKILLTFDFLRLILSCRA